MSLMGSLIYPLLVSHSVPTIELTLSETHRVIQFGRELCKSPVHLPHKAGPVTAGCIGSPVEARISPRMETPKPPWAFRPVFDLPHSSPKYQPLKTIIIDW